ncbi:MAG: bifunctional DNA-formamidopyrimidine glycosylase/DNA-(apurinic or apyrimidinic site) lyase [bacterium]|nr:bifunctional DNA-formamidopyrimidine glycosylase/DNA-(apurinic or apyrimidinic site) lyase [bacterium]
MPELPEVETIRADLDKVIVGKKIKNFEVLVSKTVRPQSVRKIKQDLIGAKIMAAKRRAKMLILSLDTKKHLLAHLKMTGQLIYQRSKGETLRDPKVSPLIVGGHPQPNGHLNLPNKYTRAIFTFTDGSKLFFNDLRKFGWLRTTTQAELEEIVAKVGPEPLENDFTLPYFTSILKRYPNRPIKQTLLDQKLIAGIGNIYADEAAFLANILPSRKAGSLKPVEVANLYKNIIGVLKLAIKKKGTSSRNYRRVSGAEGGMVKHLKVYARGGQPCLTCGTPLRKIRLASRGTHFCSKCQK